MHDLPAPTIRTANALSVFAWADDAFDCILMNPSFGVPVDRAVLLNTPLAQYGSRSETLLTAQALAVLKSSGRMAVLLPAGSLFNNSTGELDLRQEILESHRLQAVIALNKDAFQPYSTIPTFILAGGSNVSQRFMISVVVIILHPFPDPCLQFLRQVVVIQMNA